jgi:hypothetical protein
MRRGVGWPREHFEEVEDGFGGDAGGIVTGRQNAVLVLPPGLIGNEAGGGALGVV